MVVGHGPREFGAFERAPLARLRDPVEQGRDHEGEGVLAGALRDQARELARDYGFGVVGDAGWYESPFLPAGCSPATCCLMDYICGSPTFEKSNSLYRGS